MFQIVTADNLCRACATIVEKDHQDEAFRKFQKFRYLYSTLSEIKVYDDDDLPKLLCSTCVAILEAVENFKETCTRSVDSIRKLIVANLKEEPIEEIVSAETLEPIIKAENEEVAGTEILQVDKKVNAGLKKNSSKKTPMDVRPMCGLCGQTFGSMNSLRNHMKTELRHGVEKKITVEVKKNLYCTYEGCRKTFKLQTCLESHLKMHTAEKTSSWCSACNKKFTTANHYKRHMLIFHKPPQTSNLVCATCDESFSSAGKLKAHILNLHPEEPGKFACEICGISFVLENELGTHKIRNHNAHSKNRSFICHHCGKRLSTKKATLNHIILKHTDPVYETCTICHVKLLQAKSLCHYIRNHSVLTTIHKIQCKYCNKEFSRNPLLNRHLKIHIGERTYVCHQCGKSFLRLNSLNKHLYVHSGERPVHCKHCNKGFYNRHALKIHMNIHKREWIAQGQTGIELMVYATSNKSKNSNEKKYANLKQPRS